MATYKARGKKKRLIKAGTRTKWAPFWIIPKCFGTGRRVHPSRKTHAKRNWRRTKIKI